MKKKRSMQALVFPRVEELLGIDMPMEQREALFRVAAEDRRIVAQDALKSLERIVGTTGSIPLLAAANFHVVIQNQNRPGEYEDPDSFGQWHIELLQAMVCALGPQISTRSATGQFLQTMDAGFKALESVHRIMQGVGLSDILLKQMEEEPADVRRKFILSNSWMYASVQRNFAWPNDLDEVYSALFSRHDEYAQNDNLLANTYKLLGKIAGYQGSRISHTASRLHSTLSAIGWDWLEESFSDKNMVSSAIEKMFSEYCLSYIIYESEICSMIESTGWKVDVPAVLNRLSLNKEGITFKKFEHMLGENPVHERPYLQIEDHAWACFTPGTLHTYRHDHAISTLASDKERATFFDARTDYLEAAVADLFQAKFNDGLAYRNVEIADTTDSRHIFGESDLVLTRNHISLVVESKSGALSKPARRGADNRVQNWLADNAVSGSDQARRMTDALKNGCQNQSLNEISRGLRDPNLNMELVVCMEPPPFLFSRSTTLLEAALLERPIAPVMSIFEIRVAARLLEQPYHFAHYLWKRCCWEHNSEFEGDGIDLLALYLHAPAADTRTPAFLMLMSLEVDKVIGRQNKPASIPKWPALSLSKFWRRIVEWSWFSGLEPVTFVVLDTDYYDQQDIEKKVAKLRVHLFRNWSKVSQVQREWKLAEGVYFVAEAHKGSVPQAEARVEVVYDIVNDSFSVRGMHLLRIMDYFITGSSATLTPQSTPDRPA